MLYKVSNQHYKIILGSDSTLREDVRAKRGHNRKASVGAIDSQSMK